MKAKNILKTLALSMLLVSACNKMEIADEENTEKKGFALPVTVNVTREGDDATKATYNESTKKLAFSAGDKLFVMGSHLDAEDFVGVLDYDAVSGNFSGTVTTKEEYTGTIDGLMASASAVLMPAGYGSYEFFSVSGSGYETSLNYYLNKAFALTKAAAVEQFSLECALLYNSGFALVPMNAIVSFTISGLTANKEVDVSFDTSGSGIIIGNVTTSATGVATFAVGVYSGINLGSCTLTVDGINIAMPSKQTETGHIYNINRSVAPENITWNSSVISGINIINNGSFESNGITVALSGGENSSNFDNSDMYIFDVNDYFTFTSSVGNIKKIEINYTGDVEYWYEPSDGWSLGDGTLTWEGDDPAKSVTLSSSEKLLSDSGYSAIEGITSIVFTLE